MRPRPHRWRPNSRDLARLAIARASSRLALGRAGDAFCAASLRAFRSEIAATVRFVSPFLLALLEGTSLSVDDAVREMTPALAWPDRPGIPAHRSFAGAGRPSGARAIRTWAEGTWKDGDREPSLHGVDVVLPDGVRLHVRIVDHSIEAAGRVAGCWFASLFGTLLVWVPARGRMAAMPVRGGRLEDALDLPDGLRRGWIVEDVAPGGDRWELRLAVRTGVARCRLPRPSR